MYSIFGFYKFKKIKTLKKYQLLFQREISKNNVRGTIILSSEGINGTIAGKKDNISKIIKILKKLNGKKHFLISSVCISKNGSMIWNYTDKAELTMKNMSEEELKGYLSKINDETLYAYNVYQIEGEGRNLFSNVAGDKNSIMGLPILKIKEYLKNYQWKNL